MMCNCWQDDPHNRPSFAEISAFIGSLLNGQLVPAPGSDSDAGYNYTRNATKNIPDDYIDQEEKFFDDDYIVALPNSPETSLPTTSTTTNDTIVVM